MSVWRGGVGVVLALAAASVSLGPALALPSATLRALHASPHPTGLQYAALGDSYAAGLGLPPYTNQPAAGCSQSAANYAHEVASAWELYLNDASCSGAVAANIVDTPQQTGQGTAPPQSEALNSDTQVVTVSIGGNDLGFARIASYCTALSEDGPIFGDPQLNSCRAHFQPSPGTDLLQQRLTEVVEPAVHAALASIVAAAPNAVVIVVGYPAITPDAAHTPDSGCFRSALEPAPASGSFAASSVPFTNVDVPYLHSVETGLNTTLKRQAEAIGARYIDAFDESLAHSACAAPSEAYVNGITLQRIGGPTAPATPGSEPGAAPAVPGQPEINVEPGALHPNAAGVSFLASKVRAAMRAAFPAPAPAVSSPSAAPATEARSEWTFPLALSTGTVIGIISGLLVAAGVATVLWRRRALRGREQGDGWPGGEVDREENP